MTPNEFKAWFDGFTEAFTGVPTKAQWTRVKERVAEIDGKPVTERVYVDRYLPNQLPYYREYRPYWQAYGASNTASTMQCAGGAAQTFTGGLHTLAQNSGDGGTVFNSSAAMLELGRADAKALHQ